MEILFQVKAVVTNDALQVVQEVSVKFDQDLPEFGYLNIKI